METEKKPAAEKKLETMEEELKLLKGEVKQSLSSVRDYLLNMELPSSDLADVLEALNDDKEKVIMQGSLNTIPSRGKKQEPVLDETEEEGEPEEELPSETEEELQPEAEEEMQPEAEEEMQPEAEEEMQPEEALVNEDEDAVPEDELLSEEEPEEAEEAEEIEGSEGIDEIEEPIEPEAELPLEEEPSMAQETLHPEANTSIPRVNLLANLVHWVARAKKEIGSEQLPAFLEVYGISGHLSPELKELILHMADISLEQPEDSSSADIWSQSMLSLHGILTGADAPRYVMQPFWSTDSHKVKPEEAKPAEEPEEEKQPDTPIKLKLVLPGGNGKSKEFCLDLRPTADGSQD